MKKILLLLFLILNFVFANAQCWKSVSAGPDFVLTIKTDGTLWAWGDGYHGVLGNGTNGPMSETITPIQVGLDTNWKAVSCGTDFVIALKSNGTLWGWGSNEFHQLGSDSNDLYVPRQIGSDSDWTIVSCGYSGASAIKENGTLWTWGNVIFSSNLYYSYPTRIGTDSDWKFVADGSNYLEIIKTNGTLWALGSNDSSQLGDGTNAEKDSPVQIGTDNNWLNISCLGYTTAAVKTDGTLWSWGRNIYTGNGAIINSSSPVQLTSAADWQYVSIGTACYEAIKKDGTLWAWGANSFGALGDGTTVDRTFPVQITTTNNWQLVCAGFTTTIALQSDNTLWVWGGGSYYANIETYYPYQVSCSNNLGMIVFKAFDLEKQGYYTFITWQTGSEITSDHYEIEHSADSINFSKIAVITSDKKVQGSSYSYIDPNPVVGINYYRIKSVDINGNYVYSPVKEIIFYAFPVSQCWKIVSGGDTHTVAIKNDNTLWAWGDNSFGQLGDSNVTSENQPYKIGADSSWDTVSCGTRHTLAIKKDGTLWAWGYNSNGQLGDGTTINKNIPVQIGTDNDWKSVAASDSTSFALKVNGTLWAWGMGPLGDSTLNNQFIPKQISSEKTWSIISPYMAIKNDGTIWAWGADLGNYWPKQIGTDNDWQKISSFSQATGAFVLKESGTLWQLYNNYNPPSLLFEQVGTDTDWESVVTNDYTNQALKKNGTLWGWGHRYIGDGIVETEVDDPKQIITDAGWNNISISNASSFAIKEDGSLYGWGYNVSATIGDGTNLNRVIPVEISCSPIIAPVAFLYFNVTNQSDSAIIVWQTSAEENVNKYQVERSPDSITFNKIGEIVKTGQTINNYNFIDAGLNPGIYYYRIKVIYDDGSYAYSNVRSIVYQIILKGVHILLGAQLQNKSVVLSWETDTDINTRQYNIEKGFDSSAFNVIGAIESFNTENGNTYTYTDTSVVKGYTYYKIQGLNKDGSNSYSNIKSIFYNGADSIISSGAQVSLYPNPVSNTLYLQSNFTGNTLSIVISEMSGRITGQYIYQNSSVISIPVSNLNNGIYTVKISNGVTTVIKKFVKG